MKYILVQHTVEDYNKWRSIFDEQKNIRKTAGCKGESVFQNADNPNQITILLKWDSLKNARAFTGSNELREAMQRAGVLGPPDVYFLDDTNGS